MTIDWNKPLEVRVQCEWFPASKVYERSNGDVLLVVHREPHECVEWATQARNDYIRNVPLVKKKAFIHLWSDNETHFRQCGRDGECIGTHSHTMEGFVACIPIEWELPQ